MSRVIPPVITGHRADDGGHSWLGFTGIVDGGDYLRVQLVVRISIPRLAAAVEVAAYRM